MQRAKGLKGHCYRGLGTSNTAKQLDSCSWHELQIMAGTSRYVDVTVLWGTGCHCYAYVQTFEKRRQEDSEMQHIFIIFKCKMFGFTLHPFIQYIAKLKCSKLIETTDRTPKLIQFTEEIPLCTLASVNEENCRNTVAKDLLPPLYPRFSDIRQSWQESCSVLSTVKGALIGLVAKKLQGSRIMF